MALSHLIYSQCFALSKANYFWKIHVYKNNQWHIYLQFLTEAFFLPLLQKMHSMIGDGLYLLALEKYDGLTHKKLVLWIAVRRTVSSLAIMIETIYHVNLKQQKLLRHKFLLKVNSHKIAPKCDGWNKTWRFHMQKAVPNPWDAKVPTQLNLFLWNTCCLYISINKSETCFYNRTKLFDWAWQSKGFILLKTVCYYRYIRWEKGSESESTRYSRRYSKCSSAIFFKLDRNIETHIRTCLTKVLVFQLSTHRYLCNVNISLVPIRRHVPINTY